MGLFFLLIALFIASLVVLVICVIRLIRSQSRLLSKRVMNKEAYKRAQYLKYKDPVITCDYCGRKINTKKDKVCPGCGASYGTDEEWKARHNVSDEFVKKHSDAIAQDMENTSKKDGKRALIWTVASALVTTVLFVLTIHAGHEAVFLPKLRTDEVLNKNSFEDYSEVDYKVDGNGVLYEDDRIAVKMTGIYSGFYEKDHEVFGKEGHIKVGFTVTNKTKEKAVISFECSNVNGVEESGSYFSSYGAYNKKCDTTIYETLFYVPYNELSSICFKNLTVYFEHNRKVEKLCDRIKFTTTAKGDKAPNLEKCTIVYSSDMVDIYEYKKDSPYYENIDVFVMNKTGLDMMIECDGVKCDGKNVAYPYNFYDTYISAGDIFNFSRGRAFIETYGDIEGKDIEASFTFKFPDDPSRNRSTGYFDM